MLCLAVFWFSSCCFCQPFLAYVVEELVYIILVHFVICMRYFSSIFDFSWPLGWPLDWLRILIVALPGLFV